MVVEVAEPVAVCGLCGCECEVVCCCRVGGCACVECPRLCASVHVRGVVLRVVAGCGVEALRVE